MDSSTIISLAGIASTLAAALGGAWVTGKWQVTAASQAGRRACYADCMNVMQAQVDALRLLLASFRQEPFNVQVARVRLDDIARRQEQISRAVGIVVVEGPTKVTRKARGVQGLCEGLMHRLEGWVTKVENCPQRRAQRRLANLLALEGQHASADMKLLQQSTDAFGESCRRVLRPKDPEHPDLPRKVRRAVENRYEMR